MSFYNPSSTFSRPKTYDPDLANRPSTDDELGQLAERIAEKQRRSLREELGLSDSEGDITDEDEEAKSYDGEEAVDLLALREEFGQLQQRYMAALQDVHSMGEKERKAVEQLAKLRQMSKSQVTIMNRTFKEKHAKQMDLIQEMVQVINDYEGRLVSANVTLEKPMGSMFKEEAGKISPVDPAQAEQEATQSVSADAATQLEILQKQLESLENENAVFKQCLGDLSGGSVPLRKLGQGEGCTTTHVEQQQKAKKEKSSSFSDKLSGLSEEEAKTKLVKALKAVKSGQAKLAALEKEKKELLELLSEARTELEKHNNHADALAVASMPPLVPSPSSKNIVLKQQARDEEELKGGEETSNAEGGLSKSDKVKQKFEALKNKLKKSEAECVELKATVQQLSETLKKSTSESKGNNFAQEQVEELKAALDKERLRSKQISMQLSKQQSGVHSELAQLQSKLKAEKANMKTMKKQMQETIATAQKDVCDMVQKLRKKVAERQDALSGVVAKYEKEYKERRRLFNLVQELRGNIRVLCRVRPPLDFEEADVAVRFPEDGSVEVRNTKGRDKRWEFDHVFKNNATNEQVFGQVSDLCTSILDGYNVCIFAYGQTGSGKTHTMEGPEHDPGVNFRALQKLFENMEERKNDGEWTFDVKVSLLEIYNEQIRDLLSNDKGKQQKKLEVKAGKHGMHVPGLTMFTVTDHTQVLKLMKLGKKNRSVASTNMNADSSRSHSMLSTYIVARNNITNEESVGKLHLIDLAGSERISKSGVQGARLTEATNINKSLSALGDVIQARANKQGHVPYRNSTLTYLLQDSLSNDSKTLMFVQVSPVISNAEESFCSLNFAARARTVELGKASKHVSK